MAKKMTTTATTAHQDRWELIADRMWKIPELGWEIAQANPDLAGYLILPAGLPVVIPELRSLRRPLTAANPAREDNGEFIQLPPPPPSPVPPSGGGGGSVVFPIEISQGGTGAGTAQQALLNLGAVALASKGVPGGVMPLDGGGIAPLINLPPFQSPLTFPISILQGGTGGITASEARANIGAIALSDVPASIPPSAIGVTIAPIVSGLVPFSFLPPYPTLASLGAIAASSRGVADGVAPLDAQIRLPAANLPATIPIENLPLNVAFPFTAGASFRGGANPANTPTLVQTSVDANGLPRYWLVNANAPANSRIKSITAANNGNVQIRHHNDDLSDGNVLEHTASGNVLTNGTVRPGSGATAFTGASFVPGSIYYRSDILEQYPNGSVGNTLISTGSLTISNGERWVRASDGIDINTPNKIILAGQLPASIAANTYANFGTANSVGSAYLESVYLISVYLHFTDAGNAANGHWQLQGAGIITAIQWKAGGTQIPVTFKMEGHNEPDFNCSARFAIGNVNRIVQLAFDKVLSFGIGSNGYYRIILKRFI